MLARALKEVRIPFPDDFFPRVSVSSELHSTYQRAASDLLQATLRAEAAPLAKVHPAQHPKHWKFVGERSGLQLYRERGADRGAAVQVIALGLLPGSLEDVMWGLYAPSHRAHKTQRAIMHKDYLDAALLHVLDEDPVAEGDDGFAFRFAGLKWLACAPTGKLLHKRDVCWYEELGLARDAAGADVGFLAMHSVRVPECPPLDQHGVKRASVSVAYVFRDVGDGRTSVYMTGSHAVGGKSRSWSADAVLVEMWLAMATVLDCAQAKRLTKLVRSKDVVVARQASKLCEVCDQKLTSAKGAEQCKACGKNVCDRCRMTKLIYPTRPDAAFPCSYAFCKRCLLDAKDQQYAKAAAPPARHSFQSDVSSSQSQRSNSPRHRSGTTGALSAYSSSSSADSYSGASGTSGRGQRQRDRYAQHPRPPHYSEVTVKQQFGQLSPRSSTSTAVSASFSDPLGSSASSFRGVSGSSAQSFQTRTQHALSAGSSTSSVSGVAVPPSLRRDASNRSAQSQASSGSGSMPRTLPSQRAFVGVESDAEDHDSGSEASSSSNSLSDDESESDGETAAAKPPQHLMKAEVLARLRQIEMFADDETGLVELPPSRPLASHVQLSAVAPSSNPRVRDDRAKYVSTHEGVRVHGTAAPHPSYPGPSSYDTVGDADFPSSTAITTSSARGYASGYPPGYTASYVPSAAQAAQLREREQLRERLVQMSRAAEATYLMAKYNHVGVSDYSVGAANSRGADRR